jgi:hypothetical protein
MMLGNGFALGFEPSGNGVGGGLLLLPWYSFGNGK